MAGVHRWVVARRGRHREDRPIGRIERDDGAGTRIPLLVRQREVDAVLQRLLGRSLQLHVDRKPQRVAGLRDRRRLQAAAWTAERVDVHARAAGDAA